MKKFLQYFKNRGFTLVEALVVTIIAGYCILPVVGTLQGGLSQTSQFDHREKLRMLARSRLTRELSAGAFDHSAINTGAAYHHMFYDTANPPNLIATDSPLASAAFMSDIASLPIDKLLYSYKISLAVKENLKIATTSVSMGKFLLHDLPGLKALTVMAELEDGPNVIATDSISYFAMLNIPTFSDDYIWIANPKNAELIGVDPESKSVAQTFLLPLVNEAKKRDDGSNDPIRPWNLAVHPNKKFVAYQRRNSIAAININKDDSANYGQVKQLYPFPTGNTAYTFVEGTVDEKDKALKDFGLVFRPDGKFCFVTAHSDKKLYAHEIQNPDNWGTLALAVPTEVYTSTTHEFSSLHVGNDGFLYLSQRNLKKAIRFPMYASSFSGMTGQEIAETETVGALLSIQTSSDGQDIYSLWAKDGGNNPYLTRFASKDLKKLGGWRMAFAGDASDMKVSNDGRYLAVVDEYDAKSTTTNLGGLYVTNLVTTPVDSIQNFATAPPTGFVAARPAIGTSKKNRDRNDTVLFDPHTNEFFFDDKEKPLLFAVDGAGTLAGSYTSSIPETRIAEFSAAPKSMVAMTTRQPTYVLVGTSESGVHTVETVDIYTGKVIEDRSIALRAEPATIGLSPTGETFKVGFGAAATGLDTFNTFYGNTINSNQGSAAGSYLSYSIDKHVNDFFASFEETANNAYWIPGAPIPAGLPDDRCKDVDIDASWLRKKMIPLNRGGFLMLFAKADGSAMLDWIGKHQWGADAGKYERLARWHSSGNGFPPEKAVDIAISPDDRMLAIGVREASDPDKIFLYDFSGSVFDHETQLTGWVVDYRVNAEPPWQFGLPAVGCSFTVPNPTLTNGIKLKDSITSRDNWTGYNNFPGNFANVSAAGENLAAKRDANRRFFGYFKPESNVGRIAMYNQDYTRWFYDHEFIDQRLNTGSGDYLPTPLDANQPAFTRRHIQIDFNTNTGNINQGIFTHPTAGTAPGAISTSGTAQAATIDMTGWAKIASPTAMPFSFQPTFMARYDLTGCVNDPAGAMVWSRDLANPVLYRMDTINDHIWAIKPGFPATRINTGPSFNSVQKQMIVSPDGTRLIRGDRDNKQLHLFDVASPLDSFFTGGIVTAASGFMSQVATVTMTTPTPVTLAALPFNTIKSTPANGRFELVASLSLPISGIKNAALASGGIYIMGGSPLEGGTPANTIFRFDPASAYGSPITPVIATLTKAVKLHAVAAYDNEIYIFNGRDSAAPTSWVQKYDPETGRVLSSGDPVTVSTTGYQANQIMRAADKANTINASGDPTPARITSSGNLLNGEPYMAFDNTSGSGNLWAVEPSGSWIKYSTGHLPIYITKLILDNTISPSDAGVNTFSLHGSNDDSNWTPLVSSSIPENSSAHVVDITSPGLYKFYRFTITSNHGNSGGWFTGPAYGIREIKFINNEVRQISPLAAIPDSVNDAGKTAIFGTKTVSWSAHGSTEYGSKVFDGVVNDSNKWDTNTTSGYPHWIALDLGSPDNIDIIRIHCENNDDAIKNFNFEYSDNGSTWTALQINGATTIENANNTAWNTYHVTNTALHRYYRLKMLDSWNSEIEVWEIEYFSTQAASTLSEAHMTKTMTDTQQTVAAQDGAACTTPYGIVVAGGSPDGTTATTTAMVYWPHALDSFDTNNPPFPVAWYRLDETSGTVAKNSAGVTDGTVDNPNWTAGKINNGLQMNGTSTKVSATRAVQDDFTIACWIKTSSVGAGVGHWETLPIVHSQVTGWNSSFGFGIDSAGKLTYGDGKTAIADITTNTTATVNNNVWRHVAVTRTKSTGGVKLYVDGELDKSDTCHSGNSLDSNSLMGIGYSDESGYYTGMIDDVRFYNTVLSPEQIRRVMKGDSRSEGIFRSIPPLPTKAMYHNLVWHKGKLYRIGGKTDGSTTPANIHLFDFDANSWTQILLTNTAYFTGVPGQLQRYKATACSFGDEIFVFGGCNSSGTVQDTVVAWNPDTTVVRSVATLPGNAHYAKSAVAVGSAIYLIGGSTSAGSGASPGIWKFTP